MNSRTVSCGGIRTRSVRLPAALGLFSHCRYLVRNSCPFCWCLPERSARYVGSRSPIEFLLINRRWNKSRKDDMDNHANQMDPNNDVHWESRGYDGSPEGDFATRIGIPSTVVQQRRIRAILVGPGTVDSHGIARRSPTRRGKCCYGVVPWYHLSITGATAALSASKAS